MDDEAAQLLKKAALKGLRGRQYCYARQTLEGDDNKTIVSMWGCNYNAIYHAWQKAKDSCLDNLTTVDLETLKDKIV